MAFVPSGIVTLLTDFGTQDPYVGIMKGVLWSRCPSLRAVVDLTHAIAPQDIRSGAFHLAHARTWFPDGTVHVAVVDPGVGSDRRILSAVDGGHLFLAPDNGLLSRTLSPAAVVRELDVPRFAVEPVSRTFHGRDVFAPAAAAFVEGLDPDQAGPLAEVGQSVGFPVPLDDGSGLRGEVLVVDRFGNLVTNIAAGEVNGSDGFEVVIRGRSVPLRRAYSEAEPGELLALVDSFDRVEVARSGGSAAEHLECGAGEPILLRRLT